MFVPQVETGSWCPMTGCSAHRGPGSCTGRRPGGPGIYAAARHADAIRRAVQDALARSGNRGYRFGGADPWRCSPHLGLAEVRQGELDRRCRLRDVVTHRAGPNHQFDEVGPGKDGVHPRQPGWRFMPDNTASPYSPNVRGDIEGMDGDPPRRLLVDAVPRLGQGVGAGFPGELAMMSEGQGVLSTPWGLCATRRWSPGGCRAPATGPGPLVRAGTRWSCAATGGRHHLLNPPRAGADRPRPGVPCRGRCRRAVVR